MNRKSKRVQYGKEVMDKALEAVKSGIPINTASKLYKVPRSSLHSKVVKKYIHEKTGPETVLTSEEENNLVQWIFHMCSLGCPVNKEHLINSVAVLIKRLDKQTPFVDGQPGRHWYEGFLRRHPLLRKRICENVSLSRALVSEESVRKWFKDVGHYLKEKNLENIDSSRIFNTDETALLLNPKAGSVLARKGSKNVYNIVNNNEKENLTVLVTGNAAGQLAPTLVVFNYKRVPNHIYSTLPQGFHVGKSEKGWMTAMLFYEYIANKFWPWIVANNIQLPVILFLDGHVSHLTQPLSDSNAEGIILQSNDQQVNSNVICTFYMDDNGDVQLEEHLTQFFQDPVINDSNCSQLLQDPLSDDSNSFNINNNNQDENKNPNINKENTSKEHQVVKDIENYNQIKNADQSNKAAENIISQNLDSKVPLQFKDFIFWPKENISKKTKRAPKVKMPSVLLSEEGLRWYNEQEEKKRKIEEEKELKKRIRAEKTRIKKEETEKKKQLKKTKETKK